MKKIPCILLLFLFIFHTASSQDQHLVDSLVMELKTTKQDTTKTIILNRLAKTYIGNDPEMAIDYAKRTLALSQSINYNKGICNAYSTFGSIACDSGNYEAGMMYFKKSLKLGIDLKDDHAIASSYQNIGNIQRDQGKYGEALKNYNSALRLFQKLKNKNGLGYVYNMIGIIYECYGDYTQGLNYYFMALKINEEIGNKRMVALSYSNIGSIYISQFKDSVALIYCLKALKIQEELGNKRSAATTYVSIGIIYSNLGDYTSALNNYNHALQLQKHAGSKITLAATYRQIGEAYANMGQYQEALKNCLVSIKMSEEISDQMGVVYTSNIIGSIYAKQKIYNTASTYLKSALNLGRSIGVPECVSDSYEKLIDLETTKGNYKQALEYYKLFIASRDSLINEANDEKMLQQKMQYDFDKKETIIKAEQQKKDVVVQQQLQKQKIIRNSFISGSVLLLLLIIVLINRNKLKRTVEMEKMRSRLSRDLHDDIGSTLSSINILSRTAQSNLYQSGNEKTKASLEKINERSQRLLDNMSDIIWNINPGNDTIEEVMSRMREYATTILEAKNIDYTFNFPKEKMDCKLSMEVKNNMYLIFKEAVNNLSKYSGASNAYLSLTFDEKYIHLKVEDNGNGFNEQEIKHRGGLSNMQHRAEEIKGVLKISSVINKGTEIELSMPRYC